MADNYTIISADTHAGGSHAQYRDYLDPAFVDEFDAWRDRYRNPYKDLKDTDLRIRNWDSGRRWRDQEADGVVAEVVFPNTIPPFFPSFVLFAPPPSEEDYPRRLAGIRAHNRWLADFVAESPERRAGIGQIFLNNIDDAIADVRWIKEHNLRGGVLLPNIPPDVKWIKPLHHPDYDPLWKVCEELQVPVSSHGGTGAPEYAKTPASAVLMIAEVPFYSQRPLQQLLLGGVFHRFPDLRFVITESGCAWIPQLLKRLDYLLAGIRKNGAIGELRFSEDMVLPLSATAYFLRNVWVGVSQPSRDDARTALSFDNGHFMWGSDYPHDEGTGPFTREHLRQLFHDTSEVELRAFLGGNAAQLYDFDLGALDPLAARFGPTVDQIATPLETLPEHPNEALLKAVAV
ncbi:MAG TPA: amidohydrolase family protein [Acidimicrobiales bacterium]|jgi:predicted TIM-barrel fold metal-dependent hydrolase|nr:amidohydrolase family protein [Acidimicrobiales bacterium]